MAVYFDNAATSYPKPPGVLRAVEEALAFYGGNPGHGGHRMAMQAAAKLYEARAEAARFFGAEPENLVFTPGCTYALNQAIRGVMAGGGRILVSMYDHNASLRPAAALEQEGVCQVGYFPVYEGDPGRTVQGLRERWTGDTRAVVCTHASNVTGYILPVKEIGELAHRYGARMILDAAQTAGVIPADLCSTGADILCAAGHKGLLGPMGTGVMALRDGVKLPPLTQGGTGVYSLDLAMPEESPERYEAGTLNFPGFWGLAAGIRTVRRRGIRNIYRQEAALAGRFAAGLGRISRLQMAGQGFRMGEYVPVVSFTAAGWDASELAELLSAHGFMLRGGYHCAGKIHTLLGTEKTGTVRFSCGAGNTAGQVDGLLAVLKKVTQTG